MGSSSLTIGSAGYFQQNIRSAVSYGKSFIENAHVEFNSTSQFLWSIVLLSIVIRHLEEKTL